MDEKAPLVDSLLCTLCQEQYDGEQRKPMILPGPGGHTICRQCVDSMIRARARVGTIVHPFTRAEVRVDEIVVNRALLDVIRHVQLHPQPQSQPQPQPQPGVPHATQQPQPAVSQQASQEEKWELERDESELLIAAATHMRDRLSPRMEWLGRAIAAIQLRLNALQLDDALLASLLIEIDLKLQSMQRNPGQLHQLCEALRERLEPVERLLTAEDEEMNDGEARDSAVPQQSASHQPGAQPGTEVGLVRRMTGLFMRDNEARAVLAENATQPARLPPASLGQQNSLPPQAAHPRQVRPAPILAPLGENAVPLPTNHTDIHDLCQLRYLRNIGLCCFCADRRPVPPLGNYWEKGDGGTMHRVSRSHRYCVACMQA